MPTECQTFGVTAQTLVFSGTTLGNHVSDWTPQMRLIDPVQVRHNFWASDPLLDGSYPALVWQHKFSVYFENNYRLAFAKAFCDLSTHFQGDPYLLQLKANGVVVAHFGDCYLETVDQSDPKRMLAHAAGLVDFVFSGTVVPSIIL